MDRLSLWDEARTWRVPLITFIGDHESVDDSIRRIEDALEEDSDKVFLDVLKTAKELVFDVKADGAITLTPVSWILDLNTQQQALMAIYTQECDESEAKGRIMSAMLFDVPVIPNRPEVSDVLEVLVGEVLNTGFTVLNNDGSSMHLRPRAIARFDRGNDQPRIRSLVQPAEVVHLVNALDQERRQNERAKSILASLDRAILDLQSLLAASERNEHDLQRCLSRYPIFFGPSYRRVIPKHRLGSEYELDYALELLDGSIDVVEIEASTHRLYGLKGDPTSALVHAEQQVLDWLAWLDEHSPYARANLPGVRRATGIVVIGRRTTLTERDVQRLAWRNDTFGGRLVVLTFDDLLERARSLRRFLREEVGSD
ncbi:Shedu anti-phage system protein SduA domain-containing protein [Streptosporangium sp. NPDC020072]|uniref:Shedu anti-phage system protein SduA domain-containing protein n=1 Tax=Streptosporangium sp. NPDC020072 TaxID=3154788 RepID=UPI00344AC876